MMPSLCVFLLSGLIVDGIRVVKKSDRKQAPQATLDEVPSSAELANLGIDKARQRHIVAELAANGRSAVVKLPTRGGQLHEFQLELASVYSRDAVIAFHGAEETQQGLPTDSRFVSRARGRRASALVHSNGSVSGLFQYGSQLLRIQPLLGGGGSSEGETFLQTSGGHLHSVHVVHHRELKGQLSSMVGAQAPAVKIAIHDVGPESDHHDGVLPPLVSNIEIADQKWDGDKWYPGCYTGDDDLHALKLGVVTDHSAWQLDSYQLNGFDLQGLVEAVVSEASLVFEMQMNIRLDIGELHIFKPDNSNSPSFASAPCVRGAACGEKLVLLKTWAALKSHSTSVALWHLFTGCRDRGAAVGIAYCGVLCGGDGFNTGVSTLLRSYRISVGDIWETFAHEIGHNLGADHSHEEGEGKTGGIMDYGPPEINGVIQFNTKYRKAEMCTHITNRQKSCYNNFAKAPPVAPTPAPTSAPKTTTRPPRRDKRRKR